jgi:hypothetical protein
MFWDSTKITLFDSVLFSLLAIMVLYFVGSGLLRLICGILKKNDPIGEFDFVQRVTFDVFFGLIFISFAVLVFSIFSVPILFSTIILVVLSFFGFVKQPPSLPRNLGKKQCMYILAVFIVLTSVIFIASTLIVGLYGSTIDDGADHTLMIRIILNNPNSLVTRLTQPFANFFLSYPSGTHVVSAFFVTLLNVQIQKIVLMLSAVIPALIVLSFYSTIKCLFENKSLAVLGSIVAGFFGIGLFLYPISWGGLPLLLSYFVSISSIGFIFVFLTRNKFNILSAVLLGLIFFIASRIYPVALFLIIIWFILVLSSVAIIKFRKRDAQMSSSLLSKETLYYLIAFLVPILFTIPYLYSTITNTVGAFQSSITSSGSWLNVSAEIVKVKVGFDWLFDFPKLSILFSGFDKLFVLAPFSLFILVLLFIPFIYKVFVPKYFSSKTRYGLLLIYSLMLLILAYLTLSLYLPIPILVSFLNPERVLQHIFIPLVIMTTMVIFCIFYVAFISLNRLFDSCRRRLKRFAKIDVIACILLILIASFGVLWSSPLISEQQKSFNDTKITLNAYSSLNLDDMLLMNWIAENALLQGRILVSAGDSGQFVAAVTQKLTILYAGFKNYSDLMAIMTYNSSDLRAVPLMIESNISYVYVGSTGTTYALQYPFYRQFNVTQLLSSLYFSLVKQFGNAWLFQFNSSVALAAYSEAGPLPPFVDSWHPPTYINILAGEGGFTTPPSGTYYGSGRLAVEAFAKGGYKLDQWLLNGSYLTGPENVVIVDYWNWTIQPVFAKTD